MFCKLDLDDPVPDHSTFSKNRLGRFRDSQAFRLVFETVLKRCMAKGLVRGEGFATDASIIKADAQRQRRVESGDDIDWGDTNYGSASMLRWLVDEKHIEPYVPVFDKSERTDGTFGRSDFT